MKAFGNQAAFVGVTAVKRYASWIDNEIGLLFFTAERLGDGQGLVGIVKGGGLQ